MGRVIAERVHGPGDSNQVEIVLEGEKIHASGRFSNVYVANLTQPVQARVAIKNAWTTKSENKAGSHAEISLLAQISHPHIISLLYHFNRTVDNDVCHCMVFDFLPADVSKLREQGREFDALDAKLYGWQLISSIDYLSSKGIAHLDIKPANLIVDDQHGILKLSDFGNAKILDAHTAYLPYQVTRYYRAPELLFGANHYGCAVDTWSLGCVMYEFATNRVLLKGKSKEDQAKLVIDVLGYPQDADVKAMRVSRPRLGRRQFKGFPKLIQGELEPAGIELVSKMLVYNPDSRMKPSDALVHPYFDAIKTSPPPTRGDGRVFPRLAFSEDTNGETADDKQGASTAAGED